jgi:predicted Zn-dependent peptidase
VFSISPRSEVGNSPNLAAFNEIIDGVISTGIDPRAIELAKRSIARDFLDNLRSSSSIAQTLASSMTLYRDWRLMFRWFEETMAVTPADVNRVAAQYLKRTNRTVATIESEVASR